MLKKTGYKEEERLEDLKIIAHQKHVAKYYLQSYLNHIF